MQQSIFLQYFYPEYFFHHSQLRDLQLMYLTVDDIKLTQLHTSMQKYEQT